MNSRNYGIIRLLMSRNMLAPKPLQYLSNKSAVYELPRRLTSTTSTSKGQAISLTDAGAIPAVNSAQRKLDLTFEDSETAFKSKSSLELLRGYLVFQLCSINLLVDNQKTLLGLSRKVLGKNLFSALMKSTFYGHFVAGEDQKEIRPNIENMMKYGVKSILDYSAEEDLTNEKANVKESGAVEHAEISSKRKLVNSFEKQCEKNTKIFMDCIDAVQDVTKATGLGAVKLTSLLRPELLLKFSSFTALLENSSQHQDAMIWKNLCQMSESQWKYLITSVQSNSKNKLEFSSDEINELRNMVSRIDEIIEHAAKKQVRVFVDAEQTYFQSAIRRLTVELMRNFNKSTCIVLNTYQNYLKSAFDTLSKDVELAEKENFRFGAKLVRGAYMEQERARAKEMGYEDPINEDYDATTRMYEKSLLYCLEQTKRRPLGSISVMVASHNEATVKFAVEKMAEYNIKPNDRVVCFGQLLGMCDYISFYLGGVGYSVYKYVPYGPVEEVLPYLSRRATENRGIFEKVKKEKRLLLSEIKRRMKSPLFG